MKYCGKCRQMREDFKHDRYCPDCVSSYQKIYQPRYKAARRKKFPAYNSKERVRVNGARVGDSV